MDLQQNLDLGILMDKKFMAVDYSRQNQRQKKQQNSLGELVCCGNHVFRVINGKRYWISTPPDGYEDKIWHRYWLLLDTMLDAWCYMKKNLLFGV